MTNSDFSKLKDNNPYKEKCETVEESLNTGHELESIMIMGITLEKLTKELIRYSNIYMDPKSSQNDRIKQLWHTNRIPQNLSQKFHKAKNIRNDISHGNEEDYSAYAPLMKSYFLEIMMWYDKHYVTNTINPKIKLKQYLNEFCDDATITKIIEQDINDEKITKNFQIIKRIKEELINYVNNSDISAGIKKEVKKEIYSGIIKNIPQIEEKINEITPIEIGVANIINTKNQMKYTIQSIDIHKEIKENMKNLEYNQHQNKQLQKDFNDYGLCIFTTDIVAICQNEAQSKLVKQDEITFNANKSYNNKKKEEMPSKIGVANIINTENMMKYTIQSTDIDKEIKENMESLENNNHNNKQLQEDFNKYGSSSFKTEIVTICQNEAQSKLVKQDEITFNAKKTYNTNKFV